MKTWKRVVSSLLTFLIVLSMFTICTLAAAAQTPGLNSGKLYFNNTENWGTGFSVFADVRWTNLRTSHTSAKQ